MKHRPLSLTLLAALIFGIALSLPLQIMVRFGIPPTDLGAVADKLAPLNWFVLFTGLALAALVWRAAPAARVLAPVFLVILGWNNWLVANLDPELDGDLVMLGTAAVYACMAVLLKPRIRRLMLDPSQRWWLTPVRKRIAVPATITLMDGFGELDAETFDLSEGGVFISLERARWSEGPGFVARRALAVGTQCSVRLTLDGERTIRGVARVVRHADPRGRYPEGFAVHFEELPGGNRQKLRTALS